MESTAQGMGGPASAHVVLAEPASASDDEGELQADAALAQVVAHGIVVAGRRAEFDLRIYASSIRELRDPPRRGRRAREYGRWRVKRCVPV
jgi:hypothetical protein